MSQDVKNRIDYLTDYLSECNYQYYMLDNPTISDFEFDKLLEELINLEKNHPQFAHQNSPTQRVGGTITKVFPTVKHDFPMLSLSNTYSEEELFDFDKRIKDFGIENPEYICELKFDGIAISLKYENSNFVQAVTRGDGVQGDDVSPNVKTIYSIPLTIKNSFVEKFEIRGEIIMPHKVFHRLNEERVAKGEEPFANPRNAASGSMKLQDSAEVAKRRLECYLYNVHAENIPHKTHSESLEILKKQGFNVPDNFKVCKNMQEVQNFINYWDVERKNLDFDIDGIVVKINDYALQQQLGSTAKSPRWAIAYKFKAEQVSSQLREITYQVGRTGAVTPVANIEPVQISGTVVKRASLHNADIIRDLDLHHFDWVFVEKGGEIIPKIVGIDLEKRSNDAQAVEFISHCPECNTKLIRQEGEAAHYCPNEDNCPPQIKGKLEHFIARKAMNIEGLGEGTIELLFDKKLLRNVADFYTLTYDKLFGLEKTIEATDEKPERTISIREKGASNIIKGIENSLKVPFERLLFALGIRFVGETIAAKLAQHFKNIDALMSASYDELLEVEDVGEQIANSLINYFSDMNHMFIIEQLKSFGLQMKIDETATSVSQKLNNQTFVVSGVFSISRDEIKKMVIANGGKNTGSISGKTDFVLAGEKMGPEKKKRAESLNIPIISEEEFYKMIE